MPKMTFGWNDQIEHTVGDEDCDECWSGYPQPCECGGLIHAHFGDENSDGNYWLETECDKCGCKEA